jgi:uncharacterized protein (TIGR02466 family)
MADLITPFIELLYSTELKSKSRNHEFFQKALLVRDTHPKNHKWRCTTYSSLGTDYDIRNDALFNDLISECGFHVNEFAKQYGVHNKKLVLIDSWLNVSETNNYQEYHIHNKSHFSLCYYVNTPDNCGEIVFRSHEADKDMFPLPTGDDLTLPSYKTFSLKPEAGKLVLFRSNLSHMVEPNLSQESRVSISMNFVLEN